MRLLMLQKWFGAICAICFNSGNNLCLRHVCVPQLTQRKNASGTFAHNDRKASQRTQNIVVPCLHMPIFRNFTYNNVLCANCHSMQCITCSNSVNKSMLQACPQCVARVVIPQKSCYPNCLIPVLCTTYIIWRFYFICTYCPPPWPISSGTGIIISMHTKTSRKMAAGQRAGFDSKAPK